MTLLKIIQKEFSDRGFIDWNSMVTRLCSSIGAHVFNLANLDSKKFYHAGSLENFRLHLVLMAPSGFGKSSPMRFLLDEERGLLKNELFGTSLETTFSPESWLGTLTKEMNVITKTDGLFSEMKRGIVGAPEFMRLKVIFEGLGITHEEAYLLEALDSDIAKKRLSYGTILERNIGTTLWCGLRPSQLNLSSGLARRFSFQLIFPGITMSNLLKYAIRDSRMKTTIQQNTRNAINEKLKDMYEKVKSVEKIDYSDVENWINGNMLIPHFEELIYKRIAVGYTLASKSDFDIKVDNELKNLFIDEFKSRAIIRENPEREMVYSIISQEGEVDIDELISFLTVWYQMPKIKVKSIIYTLKSDDRIKISGNRIECKRKETVSKK